MTASVKELTEAESAFLESQAKLLLQRARELRELTQTPPAKTVEEELEELAWKTAASGKCDYVRDAPPGLVEKVRATKGGIKGFVHHFTASNTESTLFRFKRGGAQH